MRLDRRAVRLCRLVLAAALCAVGCGPKPAGETLQTDLRAPAPTQDAGADAKIAYYQAKIERHPRHYQAYGLLSSAYLDRARLTHQPGDLERARKAAIQSIEIQPSLQAYQAMASICGFAHRFDEALTWCDAAQSASPMETAVLALRVEALIELDRIEEADERIQEFSAVNDDFYVWVSRARSHAAHDRTDEAASAFLTAAKIARQQGAPSLSAWSGAMAAGTYIDRRNAEKARGVLADVEICDPAFGIVKLHRAELCELEGRFADALAIYESMLAGGDDPTVHARASAAARAAGNTLEAQRHFQRAESGLSQIVAAGEIYSLGTLAELYADAGVKLNEARALALRNINFQKSARSRATLARIDAMLSPTTKPAS